MCPTCSNSLESLLQSEPFDCVHVLVPPDAHFSVSKAALQSGAHVFLEKPMCPSVAEADELIALARVGRLRLGVNHNFLFSRRVSKLEGGDAFGRARAA